MDIRMARSCTISAVANGGWLVVTGGGRPWGEGVAGGEGSRFFFDSPNALGDFIAEYFRPKPESDFRVPEPKAVSGADLASWVVGGQKP